MVLRYNIVTERETADALLRADAYLSTQPTQSENEKGRLRDIHADGATKSLTELAPQVGFEPTTLRLTAGCSTLELLRIGQEGARGANLGSYGAYPAFVNSLRTSFATPLRVSKTPGPRAATASNTGSLFRTRRRLISSTGATLGRSRLLSCST